MTVVETHGDREKLFRLFLLCNDRASPTEIALAEKGEAERAYAPEPRVAEVPFDSKRKFMITVHKTKEGYLSVLKGAPDIILPMCKGAGGVAEQASEMARRALRLRRDGNAAGIPRKAVLHLLRPGRTDRSAARGIL